MIKLRFRKHINEDDVNQNQGQQPVNNDSQIQALQVQKANVLAAKRKEESDYNQKITQAEAAYNQKMTTYNTQLSSLDAQITKLGGNVTSESAEYSFSRNLYESLQVNRTDEMFTIVRLSFDEVDSLSYTPDDTWCKTFTKNIILFIGKNFQEPGEHWNEFHDFLMNYLINARYSFSKSEAEKIIENIKKHMSDNPMFGWLTAEK